MYVCTLWSSSKNSRTRVYIVHIRALCYRMFMYHNENAGVTVLTILCGTCGNMINILRPLLACRTIHISTQYLGCRCACMYLRRSNRRSEMFGFGRSSRRKNNTINSNQLLFFFLKRDLISHVRQQSFHTFFRILLLFPQRRKRHAVPPNALWVLLLGKRLCCRSPPAPSSPYYDNNAIGTRCVYTQIPLDSP